MSGGDSQNAADRNGEQEIRISYRLPVNIDLGGRSVKRATSRRFSLTAASQAQQECTSVTSLPALWANDDVTAVSSRQQGGGETALGCGAACWAESAAADARSERRRNLQNVLSNID